MYTQNTINNPSWYIEAMAAQNQTNLKVKNSDEAFIPDTFESDAVENDYVPDLFQIHFELIGKAFGYVVSLLTGMKNYFTSFFQNRQVVNQTKEAKDSKPKDVFENALINGTQLPVDDTNKETIDPMIVAAAIASTDLVKMMAESAGMGGVALETAQVAGIFILSTPIVHRSITNNETIMDISSTIQNRLVQLREPAIVLTHNATIRVLQAMAFVGKHVPQVQRFNASIEKQYIGVENELPAFARPFFEAATELQKDQLSEASGKELSKMVVTYIATPIVDSAAATVAKGFNDYMLNKAAVTAKIAPAPLRAFALIFANGAPKNSKEFMLNALRVTVLFTTGSPIAAMMAVYGAETVIYAVKVNQKRIEIANRRATEQKQPPKNEQKDPESTNPFADASNIKINEIQEEKKAVQETVTSSDSQQAFQEMFW